MSTLTPLIYLALGDSYTIGEGIPRSASWPVQLAGLLRAEGFPLTGPQVIARTGWTTDELAGALHLAHITPPYDLVSLLIGVNNQYRRRSLDNFRQEFNGLLQTAVHLAGGKPGRVLILSIPDWSVTPYAAQHETPQRQTEIASEINAFNSAKRAAAKAAGTHYIDITAASRLAAHENRLVAEDDLHFSGIMYTRWALSALPAARIALSL